MVTRRDLLVACSGEVISVAGCLVDGTDDSGGGDGPDGARIPGTYTADGADISPPLTSAGAPEEAATDALVVDDREPLPTARYGGPTDRSGDRASGST